jgi:hypothetical protein
MMLNPGVEKAFGKSACGWSRTVGMKEWEEALRAGHLDWNMAEVISHDTQRALRRKDKDAELTSFLDLLQRHKPDGRHYKPKMIDIISDQVILPKERPGRVWT